jgi:hypothetical protein
VVAAVSELDQPPTPPANVSVVPLMSPANPAAHPPIPLSHVVVAPPVTSVSVIFRTVACAGRAVIARAAPVTASSIERRFMLDPLKPGHSQDRLARTS